MTRRVYIVNNGAHDYSDAERFGEIVFCTDRVLKRSDTAQMYRELNAALVDAQANDLLLVSSLTTLCMIAAGIMSNQFGEVHMLVYENGQYVERTVVFDN